MSAMPLMGTYNHNMDAKGRMAFPNKLREQLGESFIITIGLEGCLYVYSNEEWEKFTEKLRTLSGPLAKQAIRKFAANAVVAEADKQGRILIPQILREHAGLEHDITVIGNLDRAEIWDSKRYIEANEKFSDEELSAALDSLAF
ncbi:MAG: division/cell wall cluster transcriptional repressor MraZ [Huintestinicola sp.]